MNLSASAMSKDQLRKMLAHQTERFEKIYGGEVVRHAEKDPRPKRLLDKKPGKKPVNLKLEAWETYISQVASGTYKPETQFQVRPASKKNVRLEDLA